MAYGCNLCRLCTALCPKGLDPAVMFLEMRREAIRLGHGLHRKHRGILGYERRGTSQRYSWYGLPEGCDTIFFPGCTFTGTLAFYDYLKRHIPSAGIVLDCCTKPSHDLGRQDYFETMFGEMKSFLLENGIRRVVAACPNCYKVFRQYAAEMSVVTAYEIMAADSLPSRTGIDTPLTIHDPCVLRFEDSVHLAVRQLMAKQGLKVEEMEHYGKKTLCCGEGGSACCVVPEFSGHWGDLRKREAGGHRVLAYCAGCANRLRSMVPVSHLMDLIFEPEKALKGKSRVARAPMTYLNRLRVKRRLKKTVSAGVSREREFHAER